MKKLIFLFTLSLLMISMTWATTYTENFDTVGNWAGGTAGSYNAKTYTNSANPANDGFSSNSAVRESSDTHSSGYAWRVNSGAYYFRYECAETVNGFSVYMARWDNDPVPSIAIRYSTNSGSSYTDIETITGAWFTGDKAYKQYTHTFTSPITPTSGNKIYIELNKTTGERLLVDDFELTYGSAAPVPTISVMPASLSGFTYVHNNGPSAAQSFAVTGSNLTSNLSVSSTGTNYVISATAGGSYGTSLSLTQSGGAVSATVYVKLNSGLSIGDYNNENITVSGGGSATSPTVTCSGTVTSPPPPSAPVATAATNAANTSFTSNWNSVSGATGYKLDVYKLEAGSNASDLFISEYIEGGSNNKYIEIFNGTGASVDLSNYELRQYNGGSATVSSTLALSGTLANNTTYVIANSSGAIYANPDLSTSSTVMEFNGNDALVLYREDTSTNVDIFGCIGEDPGSAWSSGSHSTVNKTLVRKSTVMSGVTTNPSSGFPTLATEWDVYAQDTSSYLGSHIFSGGLSKAYVSGYEDLDVGNYTYKSVTGLTQNTRYYYVVRALNAYGTSDDSNEIEVTTTTSSPVITLSTETLSDFYYVWGHGPSSEQTFTVSGANLTANISIAAPTNYEISLSSGSGYTSPLTLTQSGGTVGTTTVYVRLKAGLVAGDYNEEVITASSTGATNQTVSCSGSIEAPLTTEIPYSEDFSEGLTGVYTYSVTGTKVWTISSAAAQCNGYQSSAEEHWLILPGINFNDYTAERMTFNTSAYYGAIDANNYLALMYSTDYFGLGDPTSATWTEITFANGGVGGGVTPSGVLDISDILGDMVFLAFIYYSTDQPTRWNVDDINIYEAAPLIVATSALDTFSYKEGSGPSDEQSFTVSGADLTADIVITAPSNYEISQTTGESFVSSSPITLTESSGSVAETTIYVRLKAGLAIGTYNNEDITASSSGADRKTVTCNGEVTTPAAPNAPEATAGTSVNSDSFYANWDAVSGATGYYLDVYTKDSGEYATDLFISEYVEGSGTGNKYIEIFNGTGTIVELSDYSLYLYSNGAGSPSQRVALSGSLADGATYVIGHTDGTIYTLSNLTSNTVINFNGDDAIALYNTSTELFVDIFGRIGDDPGSAWTGDGGYTTVNKTLVRKAEVSQGITESPTGTGTTAFTTLTTEWDMYDQDTASYLGSHTFGSSRANTYVTGYENRDVSNVTSYEVTGLDPETTYYYVVRAYDGYSQTSSSSNEIEVTTTAASTFDYPEDEEIDAGVVLIEITGGNGIIVSGELTPVQNPNFEVTFEQRIELTGDGPWIVTVFSEDEWVACLFDGAWMVEEVPQSGTDAGYVYFGLEFPEGKNTIIELKSGNGGNPTLPVELSTFTVLMNGYNHAVLTWVTQTETGVSGFYVYRNNTEDLATAEMVSNLIPATNTSQQQVYIYTDKELFQPGTYYYWLQSSDMDGTDSFYGPINVVYTGSEPQNPGAPAITTLKGIYPNPFNPSTTISYSLAKAGDVNIRIFNSRGQLVRNYQQGLQNAGNYNLIWNGQDDNGQNMSSGVYFFRMQAGDKVFSSKAVLLK